MTRCRYFPQDSEEHENFDLARHGYFMGIGVYNESSIAIVQDAHTNKLTTTFIEYVQLIASPQDVLLEQVLKEVKLFVDKKRSDDIEVAIRNVFAKYGLK